MLPSTKYVGTSCGPTPFAMSAGMSFFVSSKLTSTIASGLDAATLLTSAV